MLGLLRCAGLIVLLLTGCIAYSQQVQKVSPAGTKFFLYTPPGYPDNGPYPLLISLHGMGGVGEDLNRLLTHHDVIPAKLIGDKKWPAAYPFIVLTPLLKPDPSVEDPKEQLWPTEVVDEVVDYVFSQYSVNQKKVYVTGLSLGAHGSYSYAAAHPDKVAAIAMISGAPDSLIACQVKNIPIWAFHGSDDGQVPRKLPEGMVRQINACSPAGKYKPKLTMEYSMIHEGWNEVYDNTHGYNMYDWLLKFTKDDPANTPPYANAGKDFTIVKRDQALHLYGEYFDSDGTIANVTWTKASGPNVTLDQSHTRFPRLSNLQSGAYEFELKVTDNDGAEKTDKVKVNIVDGNASLPAVNSLTLMQGKTQQDIAELTDAFVINPETIGTYEINIRANATANTKSVRFKVNGAHNITTTGAIPFLLSNQRWRSEQGEFLICATAFSELNGKGTEGISQCFKIIISTKAVEPPPPPPPVEEATHFYAKAGTDISILSSWASKPDGTGTSPTTFSGNGLTFEIQNAVSLDNPLAIGGTNTVFRIKQSGALTINNNLTATVHADGNAVIHVNSNHPLTFGTLSSASTVNFNTGSTTIPAVAYGNLNIKGPGTTKSLSPGRTTVSGTLVIDDDVKLNSAPGSTSVVAASGNVSFMENETFAPGVPFSIQFEKGSTQALTLKGQRLVFHELIVTENSVVDSRRPSGTSLLELGTSAGGGLTVQANAQLLLHQNQLFITGSGTINDNNETGRIGFKKSILTIQSAAGSHSHLYPLTGYDSLQNLSINLTGAGTLAIHEPLYIIDDVNVSKGTVLSNGFLSLTSSSKKTARLLTAESGAQVTGDVVFQRWIPKGKQIRYISLPVAGVTVKDLQDFIPVTGNFSGSSSGDTDPSLFQYDDAGARWAPFPGQSNTEVFTMGRGYSILMNDPLKGINLIVSGPVHNNNFTYSLTANAENKPDKGWNLIGNPYASPVTWNQTDWITSDVNTTAYLLDGSYGGGRFLVWDGEIGDEEFKGNITQGQGFFVRTTGASPQLTVNLSAKADTSSNMLRGKRTHSIEDHFAITLTGNALKDKAYVRFTADGSTHFDESDAVKRRNGYFSLSTLSQDSVELAINHFTKGFCDQSIALSLADTPPGNYTLTFNGPWFDGNDSEINLSDHFTGKVTAIGQNKTYNFSVTSDPKSAGRKRFQLVMPTGTVEDPIITVEENVLTSNVSTGNQWLFNGEEIEGATGQTYVAEASGEYHLLVSREGCAKVSQPVAITVTVTDVYEQHNKGISIYPNPTSDFIQLQGLALPASAVGYSIVNATGKTVAAGEIAPDAMLQGSTVDVQHLPPGVYFVLLRTTAWQHQAKVIIK